MKKTPPGAPARAANQKPGIFETATPLTSALLLCMAGVAVGASAFFLKTAFAANGVFGFPLDDPWIHLQFARNLHDFGSFSYFRDQMTTSGSTSPLYTLMLAAGFFFTRDEMVLSYVLGITSQTALVLVLFFVARHLFPRSIPLAVITAGLAAVEPRLVHASVSGMETGLFTALLAGSLLVYLKKRYLALGVTLGLAVWARPEAVLFAGAIAADLLYNRRWVFRDVSQTRRAGGQSGRRNERPVLAENLRYAAAIGLFIAAGYLLWNLVLSGSLLPNTYEAKSKYYAGDSAGYFADVAAFLASGHMTPLAILSGIGLLGVVVSVFRRRPQRMFVPVLWVAGMVLAYKITLPHLYQEGRYLMPVLPFVILLAMEGLEAVVGRAGSIITFLSRPFPRAVFAGLLGIVLIVQSGSGCVRQATAYAGMCRYINERQVAAGHWIHDHLPEGAVVATHDIGAIAFYSGRRVVDMVGLVSPEMIRNIGNFEGLRRFLATSHVTHLALLRNWFEVPNQTPLFQTDERTPEILEVFVFDPDRVRFVRQDVTRATMAATQLVTMGRWAEALAILEHELRVEPECSRIHFLAGVAASSLGRSERAEAALKAAVQLQPDHWPARTLAAELRRRRGDTAGAISELEAVAKGNPGYADAYRGLVRVYEENLRDTVNAQRVRARYHSFVDGKGIL